MIVLQKMISVHKASSQKAATKEGKKGNSLEKLE